MDRLHLRRSLARTALVLGAVCFAGLLWLALLDWFWLPGVRAVQVGYRCEATCTLEWTPDIGRGFLYLDTSTRELAGSGTTLLELPQTSARVALELRGSPGEITAVHELAPSGPVPLAEAVGTRTARQLPLLTPPRFAEVLSALAVAALALALRRQRIRRALAALAARLSTQRFTTPVGILLACALVFGVIFVAASAADACHVAYRRIDNPPYWPISLFDPVRFSARAAAGALLLVVSARLVLADEAEARRASPLRALVLGLAGLVLTNLLQGWELGLVEPTAGNQTYYSESLAVEDPLAYLGTYDERQAGFGTHARTHPPGAVLLYYGLRALVPNPGVLSLVLGCAAFLFAAWNVFAIAQHFVSRRAATFATLVFALLPSVQIYFVISLEAVVCALTTGAVRWFLHPRPFARVAGASACAALALFASFGALFLGPVLAGFELVARRSLRRSLAIAGTVTGAFLALYWASGFDWLSSLRVAARLENQRFPAARKRSKLLVHAPRRRSGGAALRVTGRPDRGGASVPLGAAGNAPAPAALRRRRRELPRDARDGSLQDRRDGAGVPVRRPVSGLAARGAGSRAATG